jgi:SPX domain protein involved in polyphosphate accumulation
MEGTKYFRRSSQYCERQYQNLTASKIVRYTCSALEAKHLNTIGEQVTVNVQNIWIGHYVNVKLQ